MILLYILFSAYLIAINFYSFWLVKTAADDSPTQEKPSRSGDGRLFLAGALGGAIAVYASMFVFKYKLKNIFLMVFMPVLAVLNIWFAVLAFRSGFTFFIW